MYSRSTCVCAYACMNACTGQVARAGELSSYSEVILVSQARNALGTCVESAQFKNTSGRSLHKVCICN